MCWLTARGCVFSCPRATACITTTTATRWIAPSMLCAMPMTCSYWVRLLHLARTAIGAARGRWTPTYFWRSKPMCSASTDRTRRS